MTALPKVPSLASGSRRPLVSLPSDASLHTGRSNASSSKTSSTMRRSSLKRADSKSCLSTSSSSASMQLSNSRRCSGCSAVTIQLDGTKSCSECHKSTSSRAMHGGSNGARKSLRQRGRDGGAMPEETSPEAHKLLQCLRSPDIDVEEVQSLLENRKQAAHARESSFGWTPILFAAHAGNAQLLTVLLDAHANLADICSLGNTALHLAARGGHSHVATMLIARNANLEAKNVHGWTPLMWSAIVGKTDVASMLLDSSANPSAQDLRGRTAVMWAARHGHIDIVRSCLALGLDLSVCDEDGHTLKDHAKAYGRQRTTSSSKTSEDLYWATQDGSVDLSRLLAQHGASAGDNDVAVNHVDLVLEVERAIENSEALFKAAKEQNWESVEAALRAGACVSTRSKHDSRTALMWAAIHDAPANAMTLIAAKASVETTDNLGWTALHHAVHSQSADTLSVLHYHGANVFTKSEDGNYAVHLAARADDTVMIQLLQAASADLNAKNRDGHTPLQTAVERGHVSAMRSLVALRADVDVKDSSERSLFALAVTHGRAEMVNALFEPVEPLPQQWSESDLLERLQGLPWIPAEVDTKRRGKKSSVCSTSSSKRESTAKHLKRLLARKSLETINEEDSDAASASLSHTRHSSRESSVDSKASEHSAASIQSKASTRSKASNHSKVSAQSKTSVQSKASARTQASTKSEASNRSKSTARSVRSRASIGPGTQRPSVGTTNKSASRSASRSSTSSVGSACTLSKSGAAANISSSPVGLLWNVYIARKKTVAHDPPLTKNTALVAKDSDGRTALMLAAQFRQPELVSLLLELRSQPDAADAFGNTALMLAATVGERFAIAHLLTAGGNVELKNADGHTAIELAATSDLRRLLQNHADRYAIDRKLSSSTSLPSLVKGRDDTKSRPSLVKGREDSDAIKPACRIRLECLPWRLNAEQLERQIYKVLKQTGAPRPLGVDVAVDPISLRPRGHAWVDFPNMAQAEYAAECLEEEEEETTLRVTIEAPFANSQAALLA